MSWRYVVVGLAACGSGSASESQPDGLVADDAASDVPSDSPVAVTVHGDLAIVGITASTGMTGVGGVFRKGFVTGGSVRVDGPCTITTMAPVEPAHADAGRLTVTHGTDVLGIPNVGNQYDVLESGLRYAPGDALVIAGPGAEVPAFSLPLTYPEAIAVSDPPSTAGVIVDRTGFSATWTGSAPARILIAQTSSSIKIDCKLIAGPTVTLPASTLADLVPGNALVTIGSTSAASTIVDELEVKVEATYLTFLAGSATVQ